MPLSKNIWLEEDRRRRLVDLAPAVRDEAFFGFESIQAREKAQRVLKHFNSVAAVYDFMNTLLSFGIHHAWKRASMRLLDLRPGERVLDVCGGTGDLAILAARRIGPRGRVVVYDINRAMIEAGMPKVRGKPLEDRIRHVQGDAEQISFPDRSFDAVMVGFGIRNVTRMRRGFTEMHRVLKPGGRLFTTGPMPENKRLFYDVIQEATQRPIPPMPGSSRYASAIQSAIRDRFADVRLEVFENPLVFESVEPFLAYTRASLNEDRKIWASFFQGEKDFARVMDQIGSTATARLARDGKLVMTKVVGGILATR